MGTDIERLAAILSAEENHAALELARANDNRNVQPMLAGQAASTMGVPLNRYERRVIEALIWYVAKQSGQDKTQLRAELLQNYGVRQLAEVRRGDYDAIVEMLVGQVKIKSDI